MPKFFVIDLETTSREPAEAHIVEWAAVAYPQEPLFGATIERSSLVKPPIAIPPETSAVHHIVDTDVADCATWEEQWPELKRLLAPDGTVSDAIVAVAHNAEYEREVLSKTDPFVRALPWLCTYKAALRVWPDAPAHSNETLRYWLGFGTGRHDIQNPHSALHDAVVTRQLLGALLQEASLKDMLAWTNEPALLPRCPIGQWRGSKWEDVDWSFLDWIINKARDMREDIRFCAKRELERRRKEDAPCV